MANRYWVGGTASWDGTAGTKWALTSGGTGGEAIPTSADDVFFDAASGTVTCTIATGNTGAKSINCTGFTGTIAGSAAITVSGSITLVAGMTYTHTGTVTLNGTGTLTTAGKELTNLIIDGVGITVTLGDNFVSSLGGITLTRGTFNANNYDVTITGFLQGSTNARALTMGSGLWTISGAGGTIWNLSSTNLTFNKDTANILLSNTTTSARTFIGGGLTYNKLTIGGATGTSTFTINAANFSELASTKTVAHTITFNGNTTITTWSVTGTSGNVVTVNSNTANTARVLTITNRTSGIDYLDVRDITAPLAPVTFYAGANTKLRSNVQGVAAIAPTTDEFIYVLNTGTSFTVPANWNNSNNEIHLFAGGGGGGGSRFSTPNGAAGGGGGGGGYTKVTNLTLTPSSSVSYAIGAAGAAGATAGGSGGAGGNTTFNAGAYSTTGGGGGSTTATPTSTGGVAGTGSTFNGGAGGAGSTSTVALTGNGSGGGGGAGGPLGAGSAGGNGFASTTAASVAGGGGGGNGGGTAGGNASSATGGTGGNNNAGVGGGASNTAGFNGGGGGGGTNTSVGVAGSSGVDITKAGMGSGSGSGGAASGTPTALSGLFGGGGIGGGVSIANAVTAGRIGSQGGIVIVYNTGAAPANGSFFFLFG